MMSVPVKPATLHVKESILAVCIAMILLLCAYVPVYRNSVRVNSDRYYYGGEEFPLDMTGNLAYVEQGYHGEWLASFRYSTYIGEHPSLLKFEYILIGRLAKLLHANPVAVFLWTKFLISILFIYCIWRMVIRLFTSTGGRLSAFVLVLFGAGVVVPGEAWSFVDGAVFDALVFQRMTISMHHYLLGGLCAVMSVYLLSQAIADPKKYAAFAGAAVLGIIASLLYAPDSVLILTGLPLYMVMITVSRYIRTKKVSLYTTGVGVLLSYGLLIIIPILFVRYVVAYDWSDLATAKMEHLNPFTQSPLQYAMAMGLPYLLALLALPIIIKKGNPFLILMASWILAHPVGEFVISDLIGINRIRYFLTPYYVANGLLAAVCIDEAVRKIRGRLPKMSTGVITGILVLGVLSSSVLTYTATIRRANLCFCTREYFDYAYPKRSIMQAIGWLEEHSKNRDIVLSGYFAGTLIPAFTKDRVYVSWWYKLIEPPSFAAVIDPLVMLYREQLSADDARAFLRNNAISFVFYSAEEHALRPEKFGLSYTFLKPEYNKDGVIIYRFIQ